MSNQIRTICPSTHEVIFDQPGTSVEEATKITAASKLAFLTYRGSALQQRIEIVKRALDIIDTHIGDLAKELTIQMGRPIRYCEGEIKTARIRAEHMIKIAADSLADLPGLKYPYLTTVNALVPALLAGNTVILRPSPQTPLFGDRLFEIFTEAGLPQNVLQVVHVGSLDVLDKIAQLPEIQSVSFTGSTAGGLRLREATARQVKPINLELGGNDAAYVRPDVDVKDVAENLVDGAIFNSGQSCCSVERVYVHEAIYEEFIRCTGSYKLGDPQDQATTTGPVISAAAKKNILSHIDDALSKGATNVTPENATFSLEKTADKGNFLAPVVLTNVNHSMITMKEETFGPVMPIMKVSSDEEAVDLMNDSDYGLTASVWTKDMAAGEALIDLIEAGTVFINRCDYPSPVRLALPYLEEFLILTEPQDLAWTGWKNSGLGCTLGPRGFDGFVKLKSYHIKNAST
ncbi:hypothetical protein N7462_001372 [Penicillium macrosclerotiorum]|uniref:uncharacterized protein n=1 Tax=Penicillium macrosclerotiorum TaxID=303699 RepID=UPI0025485887|nr:uncharacterized protein N7462_001372 [Penicillium macrosclerotiorum]KAJ5691949.1 hypothetical protein N7462_001372 [Penicillium macrosclerotiorum]